MLSLALAAAAAFTGLVSAGSGFTGKPVVSGYWPAYARNLLKPDDIPYNIYTHIDWFVAGTKDSYELDLYGTASDLNTLVSKAHDAGVTVSMSIGGWTGSIWFSDLVSNSTGREEFAKSIKHYIDLYDLDGVGFPSVQGMGCNKIRPEDSDNFLEFLDVLRHTVGPDVRLTSAVSVWGIMGADGKIYNRTSEFANYLDYVTIMAYDIYNVFATTTGPLGALYDTCATQYGHGASGASAAKIWTDAGELSVQTVGNSSSLIYQEKTGEIPKGGVTSGAAGKDVCGTQWNATASWLFRELISTGKLDANGTSAAGAWTRYWDDCSQTPFLFNNATRELIAYDDAQSYAAKAEYVRQHGMAGINMFDLTGDSSDSKLISAARSQLIGSFSDVGTSSTFASPAAQTSAPKSETPSSAHCK
ncbi:glycoside hydrolase [Auriculariales sp. MPI-PUGE-AT-0066]|nr:glycoside hydrolase [Auriculariales sp. MPI-PUGE-AT-0066]